ncbi:MAG: four helix bundle protein [Aureispira sp.]|nr:four helix bundle protein [Aureispira sp.]
MKKSVMEQKSYDFAVRIVRLSQMLTKQNEFVLSKQVLRSGTAVGALLREAHFAQSTKDYIHKMSIGLKEAYETDYWLELLKDTDYIDDKLYESLAANCTELIKMLVSSINTLKKKLNNKT